MAVIRKQPGVLPCITAAIDCNDNRTVFSVYTQATVQIWKNHRDHSLELTAVEARDSHPLLPVQC